MVSIINQPFPIARGEDAKQIAHDLKGTHNASITNQPFPVARGEDAKRIAHDLQEAQKPPKKGTLDYKLAEYSKKIHAERKNGKTFLDVCLRGSEKN